MPAVTSVQNGELLRRAAAAGFIPRLHEVLPGVQPRQDHSRRCLTFAAAGSGSCTTSVDTST
jgi:hypothetical protein